VLKARRVANFSRRSITPVFLDAEQKQLGVRHFSKARSGPPLKPPQCESKLLDWNLHLGITARRGCLHSGGDGVQSLTDESPAPLT
jgi:hypothetical protein